MSSVTKTGQQSMKISVSSQTKQEVEQLGSVKKRFNKLDAERLGQTDTWRLASRLTIPTLIPPLGYTGTEPLGRPYQSLGARGLNTLASKLVLTLLPAAAPFFKLQVDKTLLEQVQEEEPANVQKILQGRIKDQTTIMDYVNSTNARVALFQTLRYEILTGNGLLFVPENSLNLKSIRPDRYVVQRDGDGNVVVLIVREVVDPITEIDPAKRAILEESLGTSNTEALNHHRDNAEIFTQVQRVSPTKLVIHQETGTGAIVTPPKEIKEEDNPYLPPLRWTPSFETDYGTGHVEDYLADIENYDSFAELTLEGTAALSKVIFLLRKGATLNIKDLEESRTGDIKHGDADDVHVLTSNGKISELAQISQFSLDLLDRRLREAFLMTSSVTRDAERVTAEEIRTLAEDLDSSLGGMFSSQALDFQLPFLKRVIRILERKGKLTKIKGDAVKPKIITGLEALGRGFELSKLQNAINLSIQVPGGEAELKPSGIVPMIFEKLQVESDGVLWTEEEKAANAQAAQNQQVAETLGPQLVDAVGKGAQ